MRSIFLLATGLLLVGLAAWAQSGTCIPVHVRIAGTGQVIVQGLRIQPRIPAGSSVTFIVDRDLR